MNVEAVRFPSTPGGSVARGRRTLHLFWGALAVLLVGVTAYCWFIGRIFPGILGAGLTALAVISLRGSSDPEVLWLELQGNELVVQLRGGRERVDLTDSTSRRLTQAEAAHIELIGSSAGVFKGWGGYDLHHLGEVELHASNLDNGVLIETEERKVIVTPDDPAAFLTQCQAS